MIRTLTIAAAAAAVGYAIGQRASENPESRFERDRPTESGVGLRREDVVNTDPTAEAADWPGEFDTDGEVIGQ